MVQKISIGLRLFAILFLGVTCGGSTGGDAGGGGTASITTSGSAVAALFATGGDADISAEVLRMAGMIKSQVDDEDDDAMDDDGEDLEEDDGEDGPEGAGERDTCAEGENGEGDGPEEVDVDLSGTAGTYGDPENGNSITVAADDFCGDDGDNEGDGPDGNGLFAAFTLNSAVTGTCEDGDGNTSTLTMSSGTGVYRNTEDSFPEVYGTFVINGTEVDCTLFLNEDQTVRDGSSCSANGSAISLESDITCQISASNGEDDEDIGDEDEEDDEDGEPQGEDEEDF